ncbi:tRNA lysidine(34) synthetase TilS [Methylobacterium sp. Leaf85]|uniref:tRNA lysidine(34) synthetase TilS n=1 Tax=Methylobacterium sp. Leaf85 TaxID=1736241 RepID=UPI0006FBE10C|nr:tRNA lysidine(34) synthetase TilS [Methylobacterium sp. Leaf85]KQO51974.1 tRNA(Ile)-lysidine synthetase [Methylobacterium sp. Leaf85]
MNAAPSSDGIDATLAVALMPYLRSSRLLIAVSGGPDSTALMHAAARLGSAHPIQVATVDHRLRAEGGDEARSVGLTARSLGLSHHILTWDGDKPSRGIQAAARHARYTLLAECAGRVGADTILTGHTADDQAETVLMRLLAGSGPGGLAGMRRERDLAPGMRLARPFLDIPKADLVAYCAAHGLVSARDPSNVDERFARARLRRLMPDLAAEGLSPERLRRLAARMARDDDALRDAACAAFTALRITADAVVLDAPPLAALPDAILIRVVGLALHEAGGGGAIRLERLERLVVDGLRPALVAGTAMRRTLRGILVDLNAEGALSLRTAPPRRSPS